MRVVFFKIWTERPVGREERRVLTRAREPGKIPEIREDFGKSYFSPHTRCNV
jgi:hypothetical protein